MKTELDTAWIAVQRSRREWRTEGVRLGWTNYRTTYQCWENILCRVCGPHATIEWTDTGCIVLGVMEFFYEPKETT